MSAFLRFGTTYRNQCLLRLDSVDGTILLDRGVSSSSLFASFGNANSSGLSSASIAAATVLYDPYLVNSDGTLFPVPILLQDYVLDGVAVNSEGTQSPNPQYVRRFAMVDTVSGVPSGGSLPVVIRVATHVKLMIELDENSNQKGAFLPPQLTVVYSEVPYPFENGATLEATFQV
jgi:hypothetical protein